jgi:hypothetical protein
MNPFQSDYDYRLREWKNLRIISRGKPLQDLCVDIDRWWQQVPLVNHHLHPQDTENWPDPWTILSDNIYCTLTRAIGICYTLLMSDIIDVHLVQAVDQQCEEHNLVIVGGAKYILNYYPNSVLSTNLNEFKVKANLPLNRLHKQIN